MLGLAEAGPYPYKETINLSDEEPDFLVLDKQYGKHPMKLLTFFDEDAGVWRAILRCDLCERHTVFVQIDPNSQPAMSIVDAEMQMHSSGIGERMDDGWHDGFGFVEIDDDED